MLQSGVYISTDFEMVVTNPYIITYRRNRQRDMLESQLYQKQGQAYRCIGICQSSPASAQQHALPACWKTAFIYHGRLVAKRQQLNPNQPANQGQPPVYDNFEEEELKQGMGLPFTYDESGGQITVTFQDGAAYPAVLNESFTDESLRPQPPAVSSGNIGECLRLWNMGIQEEYFDIDGQSTFTGVIINTNKHMFIFELYPGSIYCRAARFVATNKGIVFNQNFRQGYEAFMIEDNTQAALPLQYDESLFSSDSCVWNSLSVYWSLDSYSDSDITLHGCQGEIYHFKKPQR